MSFQLPNCEMCCLNFSSVIVKNKKQQQQKKLRKLIHILFQDNVEKLKCVTRK